MRLVWCLAGCCCLVQFVSFDFHTTGLSFCSLPLIFLELIFLNFIILVLFIIFIILFVGFVFLSFPLCPLPLPSSSWSCSSYFCSPVLFISSSSPPHLLFLSSSLSCSSLYTASFCREKFDTSVCRSAFCKCFAVRELAQQRAYIAELLHKFCITLNPLHNSSFEQQSLPSIEYKKSLAQNLVAESWATCNCRNLRLG